MTHEPVPSYKKPPVVEVVWSVQFAELPWLTAAHTGVFWQRIRQDYPKCEEQAPIERQEEPEQLLAQIPRPIQVLPRPPLCRQWFISSDGNHITQLQADRFCINWRKINPSDSYPRYESLRQRFVEQWSHFCAFVQAEDRPVPEVDQLEMTYVNHIFQNEGWSSPSDIGNVFPVISFQKEAGFLPPPATLSSSIVFDMAGQHGRLHVSCRHAKVIVQPPRYVFRLDLTARGRPASSSEHDILLWFGQAREWIVRGFADLTHTSIQNDRWKKE